MRYNQRFLRISSLIRPHPSPSTTCGTCLYHLWYLLIHPGVWRSVPRCMALCPVVHGSLFPASIPLLFHSTPPASPPLHAKQNFKNLANLAKNVNSCKITKGFLTKLARLARFLKFCFAKYYLHAGRTHNPKPAIRIYPEPAISPLRARNSMTNLGELKKRTCQTAGRCALCALKDVMYLRGDYWTSSS